MLQSHIFDQLSSHDQQVLQRIFDGTDLPPLYSDTIAKRVFSADVHPDRLNFLLQNIARDDTIDVRSSASNEALRQSAGSKGMVYDIPSWLRDGRLSDLEFQSAAQNFIFTRVELYASSMLLLQYSVSNGQADDGRPDRLQKWLATIADVNDDTTIKAAADDETLTGIRTEIRNMAQDKEVQNMLTQEMFDLMDRESYGEEREEEGRKKERANTAKMQKRAEDAEKRAENAEMRVEALEAKIRKLEIQLESLTHT